MRLLALFVAFAVMPAVAMPVAKAHSKPSPEQVRKFNELQKKQAK